MKITHTHTRTYVRLDAWASTLPWDYTESGHQHAPIVDQLCAVEDCGQPLKAHEECYRVTQRDDDGWVCWRHVRPNEGPICVPPGGSPVTTEDPYASQPSRQLAEPAESEMWTPSDPFVVVGRCDNGFRWHCTSCGHMDTAAWPTAAAAGAAGEDHSCLDSLSPAGAVRPAVPQVQHSDVVQGHCQAVTACYIGDTEYTATWPAGGTREDVDEAYERGIAEGRRQAAAQLRAAAGARRWYVLRPSVPHGDIITAEANAIEQAARVVEGDLRPLFGWMPAHLWTPEMHAQVDQSGGGSDAA